MKFYTDYIRNRLSRGKRCLSEIEKMAITSIDNYGARGEFTLLTFFDDECYICHCKTDAGSRFRIDTMQCFKHNLKQLYAEDHISKTLANQIGALGAVGREPIFAGGSFIDKKAVVYALQQIYGRDVIQMDMKSCGKLNSKSRTLFSETITKEPLHLSLPDSNIMRFIGSEGLEVFVPLQDCSLDSPFWRETTWRNMLPENYGKCMIGQSECCYLKINFEVDCFNNIFCKVTDSAQNEKYMILHAPFGAPESMEIQELTNIENEAGPLKVIGKSDLSKYEKKKVEINENKDNYYIIDTNVFVNCPDIISKIDKRYTVVLAAKVIDELDKLKIKLSATEQKNVQDALRSINKQMNQRDIRMELADMNLLPIDFDRRSPDNMILTVALKYKSECNNPILLTSDNGLQAKASVLKITTISLEDYLKDKRNQK